MMMPIHMLNISKNKSDNTTFNWRVTQQTKKDDKDKRNKFTLRDSSSSSSSSSSSGSAFS